MAGRKQNQKYIWRLFLLLEWSLPGLEVMIGRSRGREPFVLYHRPLFLLPASG